MLHIRRSRRAATTGNHGRETQPSESLSSLTTKLGAPPMIVFQGNFLRSAAAFGVLAPGLALPAAAQAPTPAAQTQNQKIHFRAQAAYTAFNAAFLEQLDGQTFYTDGLNTMTFIPDGEWEQGLDIVVAEDRYQYTHAQADRDLVISLLNSLTYYNAPGSVFGNWQTDGWDDNLAWMVNAYMRGYQLTGVSSFLTEAEAGWNAGWNQGWDTTVAGGGIWENTDKGSKCGLSNNPYVWEGVALYQATGDTIYLAKAETIYAWLRSHLFNASAARGSLGEPGQMNGCVDNTGALLGSDNAYDSGAFIEAATQLYRITGKQTYYKDALLAVNHIVDEGPVLHSTAESSQNQWAYFFTRGLSDFATVANLWPEYKPWLLGNADAAWSRRSSLGLTWNNWSGPTSDSNAFPVEMSSAAAVWQQFPPATAKLSGTYAMQNTSSNLVVSVKDASSASQAAIVQRPYLDDAKEQQWTLKATSGGYYRIQNANSGESISVEGASGVNGAAIVQRPAKNIIPGDDEWMPVLNEDGTYSFYNLNSLQALDNPGGSTAVGTQLDQWFGNNTNAQEFYLVRLSQ